jgi:paraquat-inducible protein B
MRAEVEKQSQPIERTVSGLELMREQMQQNTKDALAFADALKTLQADGLNADLFSQLAASGDLSMAQQLAAGGVSAVDDINALWNDRAAAAAEVAAFATQTVYGQQQAVLQAALDRQSRLVEVSNKRIEHQTAVIERKSDQVAARNEAALAAVRAEMRDVRSAIASIPRQTAVEKRKAGKG